MEPHILPAHFINVRKHQAPKGALRLSMHENLGSCSGESESTERQKVH